ncbi:type I polyketide synthase [Actinokineospora spheciospongiae]|uniref:type I polyketide synthase n=1 Tax=Actinokineospora spheciospongiae TaxID=909613 RepID=UPI000D71A329|nr:type I polyketide synthase [Actinokineospora spheciospongiae]PWW62470.1 thioester reductase-like protein [Actinokineospora spheciospongiae]
MSDTNQPTGEPDEGLEPIAIIGMACRVPGATTPPDFWRAMRDGIESITRFGRDELIAAGTAPETLDDPDYVPASGHVEGADRFDAGFFGFNAGEAETMDPQHRVLCETAWAAVEDSGHDPADFGGTVGVFAGTFMNKYQMANLATNPRFQRSPMAPLARMFNDKDFLATRIAHLLDLTGPAMTVQTACSTSLVATHLACQSLLNYECDAAVVGGVSINVPLKTGYPVADSGLFSPDGHCRPFDADAKGTVPGNGAVTLVLRRLSDAVADRDHVYAVIRGSAVNNDGSQLKAGFAAPSVEGQARVITAAHVVADVDPGTIGYVEAHGTATQVGDPIEITALTQAFDTEATGYCAIGSVKANIGHLDAAAGIAGLMRAALAVHHAQIPPNAGFTAPNPLLGLERTPFYVPAEAADWDNSEHPRRAGVSSFGVGGTNAHVVLEEGPEPPAARPARPWQLLPLSARTRTALDAATDRLAAHLDGDGARVPLADVAFTLQAGRRGFETRRFAVCADTADAVRALRGEEANRLDTRAATDGPREAVFAFPGGGMQHPDMGLDVYRSEAVFRAEVDECARLLEPRLGFDLRRLLFPSAFAPLEGKGVSGGGVMMGRDQGAGVVSSLFVVEYALAKQLMAWGITPAAMIGHSLGEYVAACLAGVFSLADALEITLARGELFARMAPGKMLVIQLPEAEVEPLLPERISVSAVNSPDLTVVAGPDEDIAAFTRELRAKDIDCRKVSVPVASHSWMVEPFLDEFVAKVSALALNPPRIPFVSSATGTWITDEQATDPHFWGRHLRQPVRFADGVREVLATSNRVLLEVGPGKALTSLAAGQRIAPAPVAVSTMGLARDTLPDLAHLVTAVGRLWQANVPVDWVAFHGEAEPSRVPLPTYPFEGKRHWVEAGRLQENVVAAVAAAVEEVLGDEALGENGADNRLQPRTDRERKVAEIWCDLLGVESVGVEDDFFDLGAHSLMVTQVTKELRRMGATSLTARDVMSAPTVAAMAALVDRALGLGDGTPAGTGPVLEDEVVLDESITTDGLAPMSTEDPKAILLTGATGFVGAFLCAELLQRTKATVHCLVRAADEAAGLERVRAKLDSFGLTGPWQSRLKVVIGDLSKPLLGLGQERFTELAGQVDAVHHCGAWVNFVRPYRALKASNVLGTQEVLRFATTVRLKPVHHVSTLAVLAGAFLTDARVISENDPLPPPIGHDTSYSQSKWVAEGLVDIARSRGIPVSVYRAGGVLADSRSGATNADDYVTKVIQGCVQLGLAPSRRYALSVGTVDHLVRMIVELSLRPEGLGRNYHAIDPKPLEWNVLFEEIRRFGHDVELVPFDRWRTTLVEHVDRDGEDNALAPLMAMIGETPDRDMPVMDCGNVLTVLPPDLARPPALDPEYFRRMLDYFVRGRLLPPVPATTTGV